MRIIVSVFNNLYTDQRVEKVCKTLSQNGYKIELIGNNWRGLPPFTRNYPVTRLQLRSKILRFAYLEFQYELYQHLLKTADSNCILLSNDLDTLLPNFLVSKKLGIPLVFDSHEIFTEMPSVAGRFSQKIWRILEKKVLPNIQYMMTASENYADWFVKTYKILRPVVVQNFPLFRENSKNTGLNEQKILIYQGVINPSRGLDKLIPAMAEIPNAKLWIAGDGPKKTEYEQLTKKLGLEKNIEFLGQIFPEKLREITQRADVGLSIEENNGLSYYFSLPNKISDYIQARVPVVVSEFPEMKKIVNEFQVGETISNHSELAEKIKKVLEKAPEFYFENLAKAAAQLCWEKEEPKLLDLFRKVREENF